MRADPRAYTTDFAKSGREHKILIDYLRNNRTNTSVCAFATRATRRSCVDAARLERVASPAGSLDDTDGSETTDTNSHGSMGGSWKGAQTISVASFAAVMHLSLT